MSGGRRWVSGGRRRVSDSRLWAGSWAAGLRDRGSHHPVQRAWRAQDAPARTGEGQLVTLSGKAMGAAIAPLAGPQRRLWGGQGAPAEFEHPGALTGGCSAG